MRRATQLLALALLAALSRADDSLEPKPLPFQKEELEKLLKSEHSTRISNIYDSEAGIQCAAPCLRRAALRRRPPAPTSAPCVQVHVGCRESGALPWRRRQV